MRCYAPVMSVGTLPLRTPAVAVALLLVGCSGFPSECGRLCRPDFWESVTVGDVEAEVEWGADVNGARGADINSLLHLAIQHRAGVDVVQVMLERGADPNASGHVITGGHHGDDWWKSHRTPLQLAADLGSSPDVVRTLLEHGADPNPPTHFDREDESPLLFSSRLWYEGSDTTVALLLEHGADPNARSAGGLTPLHRAMYEGGPSVVELFLEQGADVHARTDPENFKIGGRSATPLHAAAEANSDPESIVTLLDWGADINAKAMEMVTPLHLATSFNENTDVIILLLRMEVDIEARTSIGETPLHWAMANHQDPAIVPLLLGSGANVNAQNIYGDSPLHLTGDIHLISALLDHGADIDSRDQAGRTPCDKVRAIGRPPDVLQLVCN